jgi:hypothetical protein
MPESRAKENARRTQFVCENELCRGQKVKLAFEWWVVTDRTPIDCNEKFQWLYQAEAL